MSGFSAEEIQHHAEFPAAILSGLNDKSVQVKKVASQFFIERLKKSQKPWEVLEKMDFPPNFDQLLPILEQNASQFFADGSHWDFEQ